MDARSDVTARQIGQVVDAVDDCVPELVPWLAELVRCPSVGGTPEESDDRPRSLVPGLG